METACGVDERGTMAEEAREGRRIADANKIMRGPHQS
jgi:hypothetical protein